MTQNVIGIFPVTITQSWWWLHFIVNDPCRLRIIFINHQIWNEMTFRVDLKSCSWLEFESDCKSMIMNKWLIVFGRWIYISKNNSYISRISLMTDYPYCICSTLSLMSIPNPKVLVGPRPPSKGELLTLSERGVPLVWSFPLGLVQSKGKNWYSWELEL